MNYPCLKIDGVFFHFGYFINIKITLFKSIATIEHIY